MPFYITIKDIPEETKQLLPLDAQIMFFKAYNDALDSYNPETVLGHETPEEYANGIAWQEIKKYYEYGDEGMYIRKE